MKKTATYHIAVGASTENLAKVRDFISEHAVSEGFPSGKVADLCLAVDEAYTNIIKHAYNNDSSKVVEIDLEFDDKQICVCLTDQGESFSVDSVEKPNIEHQVKKKKRGGMGVYLIHKLMDDVNYKTRGRENEIRLYKNRE
ncbi:MAG: ATP-binding protein [Balneolaceae bacterium]|nr:ATP-binding protein [Balneolaceae bacterium]MCH8548575.1 ATP-binding protein [Balneolaceae bacterium]